VTRIRLAKPDAGAAELAQLAEVLESGQLTMGPKVTEFEGLLAAATGCSEAVAVSSGTAALHLAVLAAGIGPGDEVIVPAYTFPATANVVVFAGATPVLVDVDPVTMNIDPELARAAVTPRTKAVLAVHLFGRPARVEELPELPLVEDAAGALGARRRARPAGSLGRLACFSFHPRKVVTTGEGGAVTMSEPELADAVRQLRHHGWQPPGYADMPVAGLNYRISDLSCAVGIPQLERLEELLATRTRIAEAYTERLEGLVRVPGVDHGDRHGWQAYVVQVDRRDDVMAALRAEEIECQIGTYSLPLLSAYRHQGEFPGARRAFERALALPFHSELTDAELDRVADALGRALAA
jgi:dTDP-4-amino-4,6-dideoxygalactose transaminase